MENICTVPLAIVLNLLNWTTLKTAGSAWSFAGFGGYFGNPSPAPLLQLNQKGVLAGVQHLQTRTPHWLRPTHLECSHYRKQSKPKKNFPSLGYSGTEDKSFVIKVISPATKTSRSLHWVNWCSASLYKQRIWEMPCEIPLNSAE